MRAAEALLLNALYPGFEESELAWMDLAACKGCPPVWFETDSPQGKQDAKNVCRRCPVRDECLDWAMRQGEPTLIWGGLTERERTMLRNKRRAQ